MHSICIKQEFNGSVDSIFELLSKHASYNQVFAPIQVLRIKNSEDPQYPDGVGSVRKLGIAPIMPLQEEITLVEKNRRIEYKIINNPLVKYHLGVLEFQALELNKTRVTYSIELQLRAPFVSKLILAQLKLAITLGFKKLAKKLA